MIKLLQISVLFFVLFNSLNIYSQTHDDISIIPDLSLNSSINYVTTIADEPISFEYCDDDGFANLDIKQIRSEVLSQSGIEANDNEAIIISTSYGRTIKINSPYSNSTQEVYCPNSPSVGTLTDVAVDQNKEIYINTFSSILKFNTDSCSLELIISVPFGSNINSLSFDTNGNLYYGFGSSSQVFRFEADDLSQSYLWHDFNAGTAGGDFVMLNGKLYVAWKVGDKYYLYEVTVDANMNYVSHVNLGELPDQTYGLASELGKLYGVTPNNLYRIDIDTFQTNTVATNDGTNGQWYGAAGLHEAIVVETSAYISQENAVETNNPLPDSWTNTQFGGQTIYIRIDNITTGEFTIVPVDINIGIIPQITQPNDIIICSEEDTNTFNLFDVENELLANVNQEVSISYYNTSSDLVNNINEIPNVFETSNPEKVIFVNVESVNSGCSDFLSFHLITNTPPTITPITNNPSDRLLSNCYIDSNNQGYFDLNEVYDIIVTGNNTNYQLQFFHSFEDSENNINELNYIYYSTIGIVEEIFVRVTNEEGCSKTTNFFIDGDCALTTGDFSNIYFPKYFTPNFDGYNDYWNVKGLSNRLKHESQISIFNRYGKLLQTFKPSQILGWEGILDNNYLPGDDYWYKLILPTGETFTGHFSLIR